jgi:stearoyl-CoA desaturase (delta-9 desaturase)
MDIITPAAKWASPEHAAAHAHEEHLPLGPKLMVLAMVVVPFLALVAAIVLMWGWGVNLPDIWLLVGMYAITGFGITAGFHRHLTHKAFDTFPLIRYLLAIGGCMAYQGPVIRWCAIHRRHHQQADQHDDPHSPYRFGTSFLAVAKGMVHAHFGWLFEKDANDLARSVPDLLADKPLMLIDRLTLFWLFLGLALPAGIAYLITPTWQSALGGFLWGGLVRLFFVYHATWSVNSVCHVFGSREYNCADHSTNNLAVAIVALGEGWHNNHHAFPTSARHGLKWWQFDSTWLLISTLKTLRLAWNVRTPSPAALTAKAITETEIVPAA